MTFSKEYYVVDGRAKEVDAQGNSQVCPGLATPLAANTLSFKCDFSISTSRSSVIL